MTSPWPVQIGEKVVCCVCFEQFDKADLAVDERGAVWDVCKADWPKVQYKDDPLAYQTDHERSAVEYQAEIEAAKRIRRDQPTKE